MPKSAMHINVRDILAESVGYNRAYKITGEHPDLEGVRLASDLSGEITISRLEAGLVVKGQITTSIELECDRCLRTFDRPITINFQQIFAEQPDDDAMPIVKDAIDLAPLVAQEIILSLPIKILHSPTCQGIENARDQYTKEDNGLRLEQQARITKGNKRGRTQKTQNP